MQVITLIVLAIIVGLLLYIIHRLHFVCTVLVAIFLVLKEREENAWVTPPKENPND